MLDLDDDDVDAWQFEALAGSAHDDPWQRAESLDRALATWPYGRDLMGAASNEVVDRYVARLLAVREPVVLELADLDIPRHVH